MKSTGGESREIQKSKTNSRYSVCSMTLEPSDVERKTFARRNET